MLTSDDFGKPFARSGQISVGHQRPDLGCQGRVFPWLDLQTSGGNRFLYAENTGSRPSTVNCEVVQTTIVPSSPAIAPTNMASAMIISMMCSG